MKRGNFFFKKKYHCTEISASECVTLQREIFCLGFIRHIGCKDGACSVSFQPEKRLPSF